MHVSNFRKVKRVEVAVDCGERYSVRVADLVRLARDLGYERVQVITNGSRFADRDFYRAAMDAGLGLGLLAAGLALLDAGLLNALKLLLVWLLVLAASAVSAHLIGQQARRGQR
mgnify:CR=1 FL=1